MSNETINPWSQWKDAGEGLLDQGTLEFFENGQTVVQLSIFSDEAQTIAQSNPYTLDEQGRVRGDVHYSGLATVRVTQANGIFVRDLDDVPVSSGGNTEGITNYAESVADMIADRSLVLGDIVRTQSYYRTLKRGGARYVVVAAATGTVDNYLFHNLGNGLQARLLEPERHRDFLVAGAFGDGGSDDTIPMQAVINVGGDIIVREGFEFVATTLNITKNVRFVGGGAMSQLPAVLGDLFQITSIAVTSVKFVGVILDGNQQNGNTANASVGWVIS